ncbi:MAG: hypothetical protein ABI855_10070 [Bacteroidota bacterium]
MTQREFRVLFLKYFRNGCLSRSDKLLSFVFPFIPFNKNAKIISNAFKKSDVEKTDFENIVVQIENYSRANLYAKKISDYLNAHIKEELAGAYVHGSVGTSEEISYSDFDGFVILKNDILNQPEKLKKVTATLIESEKIMIEMDPLQHHGWFVFTENDFENYPEYYFPHELLRYSKCLFGSTKINIQLKKSGYKNEGIESFNKLADGIMRKLNSKTFLENYYSFKNLLSEFMLLPALFIQAKTGNGIFKKFSFEKVRNEMNEKYKVMDEISLLRTNWNYQPTAFYNFIRKNDFPFLKSIPSKYFSGSLSSEIKNNFDESFINSMKTFVNELKSKLSK